MSSAKSNMKERLDSRLIRLGLVASRSQAASYIRLGKVRVDGKVVTKPGDFIGERAEIQLDQDEQYVSRAGLKLASVAERFKLDFSGRVVLDVGSSTGGFSDYALRRGAKKIIAVDVGSDQFHASLRGDPRVELFEKTDIRDFRAPQKIDIILIDVSFISIRAILPHVAQYFATPDTKIVVLLKPQFETTQKLKHAGVVKNDTERRQILKNFELWAKDLFVIEQKADSSVAGAKGNLERFYLLRAKR
jgi:23S rRNA (cytidine1920-2'-O)/16S rRNA (cytidine1409-2'-O)-methyltransferase